MKPPEDLRAVLLAFWRAAMEQAPDWRERLKASELLAKYALAVHRAGPAKLVPSTAQIYEEVTRLEQHA